MGKTADVAEAATEVTTQKERETYTAKQVATRIGTDAKTLRKFFRSAASTVEPVGQGGRYEFDAADLPKIREQFTNWNEKKPTRGAQKVNDAPAAETKSTPSPKKRGKAAPAEPIIEEDDEVLDMNDEGPSDDDLAELEDDELDLDFDDEIDA